MAEDEHLKDLVESDAFQKLAESTDDDADTAETTQDTLLAGVEIKGLGNAALADYKADGVAMDKARGEFNGEWNKAVGGNGDRARLLSTYERYVISLGALEAQNERFEALADARVTTIARAIAALLLAMLSNGRRKVVELEADLRKLADELKKAEKDVDDARLQRTLNVCMSAAALLLGPTTILARVLLAGSTITAQVTIDYALGPSRGSAEGVTATVIGGAADGVDKLGQVGKKFVSAAAAVVSFKFDSDEIGEAEDIVAKVKARLQKTIRLYAALMDLIEPLGKQARTLKAGLDKATTAARSADRRSAAARTEYEEMKKLLKQQP